ncbi:MAG: Ig-like domain-containing protein [Candidatus Limnocylindrales bacterium]
MRKFALAILATPVLAVVYVGSLLRTSPLVRGGVALGLGAAIGLGAIALARPTLTTATPPSTIVPLTQAAFRTAVATGVEVDAPATIVFSTPMERASVEAALTVEPRTPVTLLWSADDMTLSILPSGHWAPGTYHTITVQPGALARTGRPTTTPARASFLTRAPGIAVVAATTVVGKRVAASTAFAIAFDRAVDPATVEGAIRLDPPAPGTVTADPSVEGAARFRFTPTAPLRPDRTYRLIVDGVRDTNGVALEAASISVKTIGAPSVVRFRPLASSQDVPRDQVISVRFTRSMDRASTKRAFSVTVDGKAIDGAISFAEDDKVLVFDPAAALPYDARILATVGAGASSVEGAPLDAASSAAFRTVPKPAAPKPAAPKPSSGGSSGGGSVGSGSWTAVERYYLGLMNCTRTGGIVTSTGSCSSPGGRNVAALKLDSGISSKVARPYAKKLAVNNLCTHFSGGNPGDRLRRAGYTNYTWAENLGCRSGSPKSAVLGSHLYFQSERSWSPQGGHYVNLMNAKYDRVGIGVWVSGGRVRLVVDFYHP